MAFRNLFALLSFTALAYAQTVYLVGDSTMARNGGGSGWSDGTNMFIMVFPLPSFA